MLALPSTTKKKNKSERQQEEKLTKKTTQNGSKDNPNWQQGGLLANGHLVDVGLTNVKCANDGNGPPLGVQTVVTMATLWP